MPSAYLTPALARDRLARFDITATPSQVELDIASDNLDLLGGFVGLKYDPAQHRAFPRSVAVRDDAAGSVPAAILDWVALTAYELSVEDEPGIKSESIDEIAVSYDRGKKSRISRLKKNLLRPYRGGFGRVRIV